MSERGTPSASSPAALRRMQSARQRDTKPELELRSALHRKGLRFFVNRAPLSAVRRRADVVFPRLRVAVYVDGCFWHGCPLHGTWPKANADWWREKIERNRERDRDTDRRLADANWTVVRVWEHESTDEAADRVEGALQVAGSRF
jgi:DNA mismatch endonuclease (patch repair protein)